MPYNEFDNVAKEVAEGTELLKKSLHAAVKSAEELDKKFAKLSDTEKDLLKEHMKLDKALKTKSLILLNKQSLASAKQFKDIGKSFKSIAVSMKVLSSSTVKTASAFKVFGKNIGSSSIGLKMMATGVTKTSAAIDVLNRKLKDSNKLLEKNAKVPKKSWGGGVRVGGGGGGGGGGGAAPSSASSSAQQKAQKQAQQKAQAATKSAAREEAAQQKAQQKAQALAQKQSAAQQKAQQKAQLLAAKQAAAWNRRTTQLGAIAVKDAAKKAAAQQKFQAAAAKTAARAAAALAAAAAKAARAAAGKNTPPDNLGGHRNSYRDRLFSLRDEIEEDDSGPAGKAKMKAYEKLSGGIAQRDVVEDFTSGSKINPAKKSQYLQIKATQGQAKATQYLVQQYPKLQKKMADAYNSGVKGAKGLTGQMAILRREVDRENKSLGDFAKKALAEGKIAALEFGGGIGKNATGLLALGVATVYAAGKVNELLTEFQDAAMALSQYRSDTEALANTMSGVSVKSLGEMKKSLSLSKQQASEFFEVVKTGITDLGMSGQQIQDIAKKYQKAFGGDPTRRVKEFIDLLKEFPDLEKNLNVTATVDDSIESIFGVIESGKLDVVLDARKAGELGGKGGKQNEGAELLTQAMEANAIANGIRDSMLKYYPDWGPKFTAIAGMTTKGAEIAGTSIAALAGLSLLLGQSGASNVSAIAAQTQALVTAILTGKPGGGAAGGAGVGAKVAGGATAAVVGWQLGRLIDDLPKMIGNDKSKSLSDRKGFQNAVKMVVLGPVGYAIDKAVNKPDVSDEDAEKMKKEDDKSRSAVMAKVIRNGQIEAAKQKQARITRGDEGSEEEVWKDLRDEFAAIERTVHNSKEQFQKFTVELASAEIDKIKTLGGSVGEFQNAIASSAQASSELYNIQRENIAKEKEAIAKRFSGGTAIQEKAKQLALDKLRSKEIEAMRAYNDALMKRIEELNNAPNVLLARRGVERGARTIDMASEAISEKEHTAFSASMEQGLDTIYQGAIEANRKKTDEITKGSIDPLTGKKTESVIDSLGVEGSQQTIDNLYSEMQKTLMDSVDTYLTNLKKVREATDSETQEIMSAASEADRQAALAEQSGDAIGATSESLKKSNTLKHKEVQINKDLLKSYKVDLKSEKEKHANLKKLRDAKRAEAAKAKKEGRSDTDVKKLEVEADELGFEADASAARVVGLTKEIEGLNQKGADLIRSLPKLGDALDEIREASEKSITGRTIKYQEEYSDALAESAEYAGNLGEIAKKVFENTVDAAKKQYAEDERILAESLALERKRADERIRIAGEKGGPASAASQRAREEEAQSVLQKTERAKMENKLKKSVVDGARRENELKQSGIDIQSGVIQEQMSFLQDFGGAFSVVADLQGKMVEFERQKLDFAKETLRQTEANGVGGLELERAKAAVAIQELKLKRAALGVQKDMVEKLLGAAFGEIRSVGARKGQMTDQALLGVENTRVKGQGGTYLSTPDGKPGTIEERSIQRQLSGVGGVGPRKMDLQKDIAKGVQSTAKSTETLTKAATSGGAGFVSVHDTQVVSALKSVETAVASKGDGVITAVGQVEKKTAETGKAITGTKSKGSGSVGIRGSNKLEGMGGSSKLEGMGPKSQFGKGGGKLGTGVGGGVFSRNLAQNTEKAKKEETEKAKKDETEKAKSKQAAEDAIKKKAADKAAVYAYAYGTKEEKEAKRVKAEKAKAEQELWSEDNNPKSANPSDPSWKSTPQEASGVFKDVLAAFDPAAAPLSTAPISTAPLSAAVNNSDYNNIPDEAPFSNARSRSEEESGAAGVGSGMTITGTMEVKFDVNGLQPVLTPIVCRIMGTPDGRKASENSGNVRAV